MSSPPPRFVVAGYIPDYRMDAIDLGSVGANLSHALLFSVSPFANGSISFSALPPIRMMALGRARREQTHLRALVSVGGGGRSAHFGALSADPKSRGRFARLLSSYCERNKLHGADLDWEAPSTSAEAANYEALLRRVRKEFVGRTPALELTMAMHTGGHARLLQRAAEHVDRVHLMAYDMPDARQRHSTEEAAEKAVAEAIAEGIPREKLVLGIPFYGRDTANLASAAAYRDLRRTRTHGTDENFVGSIYFNGPATVRRKTAFAARAGLAGVMIWEVGQDDDSYASGGAPLLPEIAEVANIASTADWRAGEQMDEASASRFLLAVEGKSTLADRDEL
ncbi:hypothetical protein AB1Y20_018953 [Prymnesium parvum]|uniref:GH18 domain-containing protein n=1 Tax=Prymnesium parvum TaxID=97485 RepID=A0AB34JPK3_PRYPA